MGGHYAFVGGSDAARAAVRSALDASRFDWDLVEQEITIRITDCGCAGANPGEIILDEEVLTDPRFGPKYAWGIVQHEYAHQVDFFLLEARDRRRVRQWLGGSDWCYEDPDVDHDDHACERFASSLAWAYWPRPRRNIMGCTQPSRRRNSARCFRSSSGSMRSRSRRKGCQVEDRRPH